jgi:hypothetical protein
MKNSFDYSQFFKTPRYTERMTHPEPVRKLFFYLRETKSIYEVTFHAAFAKKVWDLMRREGSDVPGFPRMQQSFMDAVQKVRALVEKAGENGYVHATRYTELSQNGMQNMMTLVGDLAVVKEWQVDLGDKQIEEPKFKK